MYISAAIATIPTLTRDEAIRDLFVEAGATGEYRNSFNVTVSGNTAGQTITGSGATVLTGDGASATGIFSNLENSWPSSSTDRSRPPAVRTLAPGASLYLNGQSLIVGGNSYPT